MSFPPGGALAGVTGPTPGSTALDQPPPSPTPMGGVPPGAPFSLRGLAPGLPSGAMPPEVLTGIVQSAQAVSGVLDSYAQVTPTQAALLSMMKDLLQQYVANVQMEGGGASSPTATGPAFPGGGMDRGIASAGPV